MRTTTSHKKHIEPQHRYEVGDRVIYHIGLEGVSPYDGEEAEVFGQSRQEGLQVMHLLQFEDGHQIEAAPSELTPIR